MSVPAASRTTPLYDRHVAAGATMVDFAGYSMPLQYSGIRDEHIAVRERAGLFDVSHMGEVRLRGAGVLDCVQRLCSNDVSRLHDGEAMYGVMCKDDAGIVDDIIVYRIDAEDYMIVVNAACREKDVAWMRAHLDSGVDFEDISDETALLALQGPQAVDVITHLCGDDVTTLASFHSVETAIARVPGRVSRTGYTGEDGFEMYVAAADAAAVWDAILEAGHSVDIKPCGLGARDTLRLEAGLRLYGQDMDESTDPYSVALGWTVKLDTTPECIGAQRLRSLKQGGAPQRFVGLNLSGRAIARHGNAVLSNGETVGEITSGTFSFTLGHAIATARIASSAATDAPLTVDIRGSHVEAQRVRLPFVASHRVTEAKA